jgi:hypothetical protein
MQNTMENEMITLLKHATTLSSKLTDKTTDKIDPKIEAEIRSYLVTFQEGCNRGYDERMTKKDDEITTKLLVERNGLKVVSSGSLALRMTKFRAIDGSYD